MLVLPGHSAPVYSLVYSPDGRLLASCDNECVKLWDIAAAKEVATIPDPTSEGRKGNQVGGVVSFVRRLVGLQFVGELNDIEVGRIASVQFSADGRWVGLGQHNSVVTIWDIAHRSAVQQVEPFGEFRGRVTTLALSPNGKDYACARDRDSLRFGFIKQGNLTDGHQIIISHIFAMAYSPDSRYLGIGTGQWNHDSGPRLFEKNMEVRSFNFQCRKHHGPVMSLTFSPDSKTLATGGADFTVRLWDIATAAEKAILTGHKDLVRCVAFSPDGRTLTSASWDGTIKVWDVASRCERASFAWHKGMIHAVAFAPDGMTGATGGHDGSIVIWDVDA